MATTTATSLKEESIEELYSFLDTKEADFGLDERAKQLVSFHIFLLCCTHDIIECVHMCACMCFG